MVLGGDEGGGRVPSLGSPWRCLMTLSISKTQAEQIVCAAFEGKRPEDEVLAHALKLCNITREKFVFLKGEMRRTSVGRDRLCVLTPSNGQRRRR